MSSTGDTRLIGVVLDVPSTGNNILIGVVLEVPSTGNTCLTGVWLVVSSTGNTRLIGVVLDVPSTGNNMLIGVVLEVPSTGNTRMIGVGLVVSSTDESRTLLHSWNHVSFGMPFISAPQRLLPWAIFYSCFQPSSPCVVFASKSSGVFQFPNMYLTWGRQGLSSGTTKHQNR